MDTIGLGGVLYADIEDVDRNRVYRQEITFTQDMPATEYDIPTGGLSPEMIILNVHAFTSAGELVAVSLPFVRPRSIKITALDFDDGNEVRAKWDIDEGPDVTTGSYVSTYDTGMSTPTWSAFTATISSPTGSTLPISLRVSNTQAGNYDADMA